MSAKGTTWSKKNHKYERKIGDVYIYPDMKDRQDRHDSHDDAKVAITPPVRRTTSGYFAVNTRTGEQVGGSRDYSSLANSGAKAVADIFRKWG